LATQHPSEGPYICSECGRRYEKKGFLNAKCSECRQFPSKTVSGMGEILVGTLRRRLWETIVVILIFGGLLYIGDVQWIIDHLAIVAITVVCLLIFSWIAKWLAEHRILAKLFILSFILLFIVVLVFKYEVNILVAALVTIPFVLAWILGRLAEQNR